MKFTLFSVLALLLACIITFQSCQKEVSSTEANKEKITNQQLSKPYENASKKLRTIYLERTGTNTNTPGRLTDDLPLSTLLTEEEAIQIVSPLYNPTCHIYHNNMTFIYKKIFLLVMQG